MEEKLEIIDLEKAFLEGLEIEKLFTFDPELNTLTMNIAYPYEIDLDDIQDEGDLLSWVLHLCGKNWMKTQHVSRLIRRVCEIKGWNLYH